MDVHKERKLAIAERLVGLAQEHLREARGLVGDVKIPLRLIHEVAEIEQELWRASEASPNFGEGS